MRPGSSNIISSSAHLIWWTDSVCYRVLVWCNMDNRTCNPAFSNRGRGTHKGLSLKTIAGRCIFHTRRWVSWLGNRLDCLASIAKGLWLSIFQFLVVSRNHCYCLQIAFPWLARLTKVYDMEASGLDEKGANHQGNMVQPQQKAGWCDRVYSTPIFGWSNSLYCMYKQLLVLPRWEYHRFHSWPRQLLSTY